MKQVLADDTAVVVVVVDQFEELFTMCRDEAVRRSFLDGLVEAVTDPTGRLRVVVTLRADFYDRPLQIAALAPLLEAASVAVRRSRRASWRWRSSSPPPGSAWCSSPGCRGGRSRCPGPAGRPALAPVRADRAIRPEWQRCHDGGGLPPGGRGERRGSSRRARRCSPTWTASSRWRPAACSPGSWPW